MSTPANPPQPPESSSAEAPVTNKAASPEPSPPAAIAESSTAPAPNADPNVRAPAHTSSLHYSLLGPSLLKAGQTNVDQSRVAEIIFEASKGSKFFVYEQARDAANQAKIAAIVARKAELLTRNQSAERHRITEQIAALEETRDLSQVIIHVDCDAFFASVEELERPELKEVPMAVGKGVLTTCNYKARQWGVRSGMASHIAKKICPELVLVPNSFNLYTAKAAEIRVILAQYDPNYEAASVDEAFLNLTPYLSAHPELDAPTLVSQIRAEVLEKTRISISAGIAPNAKLAKIASNKNKPNGQFVVPSTREDVLKFIHPLPCRQINGIGRVFSQELAAVGIHTCGDIYEHRCLLRPLFGDKATAFLLSCYLGLGRTQIAPIGTYGRKSVGTESTFRDLTGAAALREKLRYTAGELAKDLERTGERGTTLVLKIKLYTFEIISRQRNISKSIVDEKGLYEHALPLLEGLERERKGLKIRLMGLRITHLVDKRRASEVVKELFGKGKKKMEIDPAQQEKTGVEVDENGWEVWPDEAFENQQQEEQEEELRLTQELDDELERALRESEKEYEREQQREQQMDERISEPDSGCAPEASTLSPATEPSRTPLCESESSATPEVTPNGTPPETMECPICLRPQPSADNVAFNAHVDFCLSRSAIREAVRSGDAPLNSKDGNVDAGGEGRGGTRKRTMMLSWGDLSGKQGAEKGKTGSGRGRGVKRRRT